MKYHAFTLKFLYSSFRKKKCLPKRTTILYQGWLVCVVMKVGSVPGVGNNILKARTGTGKAGPATTGTGKAGSATTGT